MCNQFCNQPPPTNIKSKTWTAKDSLEFHHKHGRIPNEVFKKSIEGVENGLDIGIKLTVEGRGIISFSRNGFHEGEIDFCCEPEPTFWDSQTKEEIENPVFANGFINEIEKAIQNEKV